MVQFDTVSGEGAGYYAPAEGGGAGVVVIQEWWGLVPTITRMCDRLAAAGFSALAPDLYHGTTVPVGEPDEAGKLMMALNVNTAAEEMRGAIDFLLADQAVTSDRAGVLGFCMGGGLALVLACHSPELVGACAPYYGLIPWKGAEPDWSRLDCPVHGHYAELDSMFGPPQVAELSATLSGLDKEAQFTVHPGCDHAFANDDRPEVYNEVEADAALSETFAFFNSTLS